MDKFIKRYPSREIQEQEKNDHSLESKGESCSHNTGGRFSENDDSEDYDADDFSSGDEQNVGSASARETIEHPGSDSSLKRKGVEISDEELVTKKERRLTYDKNIDIEACKTKHHLDWLTSKHGKPYCSSCRKSLVGGTFHIQRHGKTGFHEKNLNIALQSVRLRDMIENNSQNNEIAQVQRSRLKLVMQLVEHNHPFLYLDHQPGFLRSTLTDSKIAKKIKCGRTKGKEIVMQILAPASIEATAEALHHSKFSIIIDETTDISTTQCLGIVVRYFCQKNCNVRDRFLGIIEVFDGTAAGLHESLKKYLTDNNIPENNMIGFASDNASVMIGQLNGVVTRFRKDLPNLFSMGCICHSFAICASEAAKTLPGTVEQLARDINSYFCHSSKRLKKFQKLQALSDVRKHKMLKLASTRWLSLQAVVDRMLEQWSVLVEFFTEAHAEDNLPSAGMILSALGNPMFKIYYLFLSYALELVNRLNVEFQSEKPKLHTLLPRIVEVYEIFLRNFMKREYVDRTPIHKITIKNPHEYLPLENIYFGIRVENHIETENIPKNDIHGFRLRALQFYITLCSEIQSRVKFNDPVLQNLQLLNPKNALSGDTPSIIPLAKLFPNVVAESKWEALNSEWKMIPVVLKNSEDQCSLVEFINKIGKMKNAIDQKMFPNLHLFLMAMVCLPHSSAAAERLFSQFKLIKTDLRNRLSIDTCSALLLCKELMYGKTCMNWEPSDDLLKKKASKKTMSIIGDFDIFYNV